MHTSDVELPRYADWSPSQFDTRGLGCGDRQDWLVVECIGQNRDSDALARSNFRTVVKDLGGESHDLEIHRFGHWACGWFEIAIVRPGSDAHKAAQEWVCTLADYPIASEEDHSELEFEDALATWQSCFNDSERLAYIREHWSQFDSCHAKYTSDKCEAWRRLLDNVRGRDFCGYASELLA